MGRPRRPYNGVELISPTRDRYLQRLVPGGVGVRQKMRWDSSRKWAYRVPNGIYDPLTYMYVLDICTGIDPDIELRAKNLADFLNTTNEAFYWDPVTVGRVLADLCEGFEDVLGAKNGLLERGQDYRGSFFRLHHTEDTAKVAHALRDDLMALAKVEITARLLGKRSKSMVSPLLECASLRGEFQDIA